MKYFTPSLIAAYGADDPATANAADARWDELCDEYAAYLASVKAEFPRGLRIIEENFYLHDALILSIGRHQDSFAIVLQIDPPPQSILALTYELTAPPEIRRGVLPPELCTPEHVTEWQYEEIERLPGEPATWQHSILLSNGWEIQLRFRDVRVEEFEAVLPDPTPVGIAAVSQSA
jgi:hypothetical protein